MSITSRSATFRSMDQSTAQDWALAMERHVDVVLAPNADHVLATLASPHEEGGLPVGSLEHALQTATRAERDGRDDEYVFCALIHDIGARLSPRNHATIGAAIAKPFVSEENFWMLEHHDVFQGYHFWHHLGMDRNSREAYRDSPYFDYCAEFCAKYDQMSFDTDYRSEPLEHFAPMVRDIMAPRG